MSIELLDMQDLFYLKSRFPTFKIESRPTILVVDDNSDALLLARRALGQIDAEVITVKSVEAALDFLKFRIPDILVTDIVFPRKSGFSLLEALRRSSHLCAVPALVMSGHGEELYMDKAVELGAVEYLTKPFAPKLLRDRVRSYL